VAIFIERKNEICKFRWFQKHKVVVVGRRRRRVGGAAIAASEAGAGEVTLLEKLPHLGGDTIFSDQIISAAGNRTTSESRHCRYPAPVFGRSPQRRAL
jgi:hypothetical protein